MSNVIKDLTDKILLEKYRHGNTAAYNILFKRYYDSLFKYALKNVKEPVIAEELTMDVMLRLWEKKGEISIETDLKAYLYRSIKNAIYNHYRKKVLSTVPLEQLTEAISLTSKSADDQLNCNELQSLYLQKLSELSPQRRKVYQLSRDENMTYPEIAKNMNLSVNTVENYMVASLNFFRKHLKEHADFTLIFVITFLFL